MVVPPLGGISAFASAVLANMEVDAGTGGSTVLMMQSAVPLMLAQSAARGGAEISMVFRGGTNISPPMSSGSFRLNAPQVEYADLVLFPTLRRHFGVKLELSLLRRGFIQGGGAVQVTAAIVQWPLPPLDLVDRGEVVRVGGIAYSSRPDSLLMVHGLCDGRVAGALPVLGQRFGITQEWVLQDRVPAPVGREAGILALLETSSGCIIAGDSMARPGISLAMVGEEAANNLLAAWDARGCTDLDLANQLVIFMALACGTSRLRLGRAFTLDGHLRAMLWLAERFGATVRLMPDDLDASGGILEIDGIGDVLRPNR
jgi:RNA 3'-terminal phosphate cyclase (ATP)